MVMSPFPSEGGQGHIQFKSDPTNLSSSNDERAQTKDNDIGEMQCNEVHLSDEPILVQKSREKEREHK